MCLLYIIEKIWCIFEKNQQILLKILKLAKFLHCMVIHIKNNQNLQKLTKKLTKCLPSACICLLYAIENYLNICSNFISKI